MVKRVIGLIGYKGAGKSTVAREAFQAFYGDYRVASISTPIIQIMAAMGVPGEILDNKERWNEPIPGLHRGMTARQISWQIGTNGRAMFGADYWLRLCIKHWSGWDIIIVDDIRTHAEMNHIMQLNSYEGWRGHTIAFSRAGQDPQSGAEDELIPELQDKAGHVFINEGKNLEHDAVRFRNCIYREILDNA